MSQPVPMRRRRYAPLIALAVALGGTVSGWQWSGGRLYWPAPDRTGLPDYIRLGPPSLRSGLASIGGGMVVSEPPVCGRWAVAGVYPYSQKGVKTWYVAPCEGAETCSAVSGLGASRGEWLRLVGSTDVRTLSAGRGGGPGALSAYSVAATPRIEIGPGSLICLDADPDAPGLSDWALPAGSSIEYSDGTGVLRVGALSIDAGASLTVVSAPPRWGEAVVLIEADSLTGAFGAVSLPAGWELIYTDQTVRMRPVATP